MNSLPEQLILISLFVALIPTILCVATSYLKISIVLGMVKSALGTSQTPGMIVTSSLSLLLTFYVMYPVAKECFKNFIDTPVTSKNLLLDEVAHQSIIRNLSPLKDFFKKYAAEKEIRFFTEIRSKQNNEIESPIDSFFISLPAFVLTELRSAFRMSCYLLLPFLVVDLVITTILGGMGLYMVNPVSITLPVKLLLFVSSDSWLLLMKAILNSYR